MNVRLLLLQSAILFKLVLRNRNHREANSELSDKRFFCSDFTSTVLTPIRSPGVLEDPNISALDVVPTNYFYYVIALELESVLGPEVDSVAVGKQVRMHL